MSGPFRLGLTGSIGMGKSATARLFAQEGVPVWDADAAVHALYAPGGAAVAPIAAAFPGVLRDGGVDRSRLRDALGRDPAALARLEAIVHPLTARDRDEFLARHHDKDLVLLDIPLLFEIGAEPLCDAVLVVTAPPHIQRERVMARGTMTHAELELILKRQLPDAQKRAQADYVFETLTPERTQADVRALIAKLRSRDA